LPKQGGTGNPSLVMMNRYRGTDLAERASSGGGSLRYFDKVFFIALAMLLGRWMPASAMQNPPNVVLTSFGSAGQGAEDTSIFQMGLNRTAVNGQTLEVPAGIYNVRPLYFPANSSMVLDPGVVIQAVSGYGQNDRLLNVSDVQNVSIYGTPGQSVFRMPKSEYTSGEYRHCIAITGATNVTIDGIQCNNSGGDGMYIGAGAQGYSANIKILNSGFDNNRRQGLSIISGKNILISECTFTNTTGTSPSDGIDIEPNQARDFLQNIVIRSSSAIGNNGSGLAVGIERLNAGSPPLSIEVSKFRSERNKESGFFATNEPGDGHYSVPGTILISDSISNLDSKYGAVASYWEAGGTSLIFRNLTVMNANGWKNNIDNAAIAVKRGGGAIHPMGNVHFLGTSVVDTAGNLDVYFTVYDWSHIGFAQLQFLSPLQLMGAKSGTGLFNGLPVLTFNVN
jgi:hypothetical protein